ncbi:MAG: hypothetical protein D4S02_04630 [Rhodocyclaceae bacterium]|nr:MAG: hypothetical protein D4S02_04630 [Rhodocyclaceae bacterium]
MPFHLILPGLLWPQKALRDTAHDLPLPNLSWLLGRGKLDWQDPLPVENWLCRQLGCFPHPQQLPAAALRLLGEGGQPGDDIWLCADPVHLRIEQGRAHLFGGELDISADEMQQLSNALSLQFAEVGEYHAGPSGHGYLRLRRLPRLVTTPPSAAAGRGNLLPSGEDAGHWSRLVNQAQMLLHALPLNARREAQGRPRLNSLWLWGAGSLPAAPVTATGDYRQLIGDHPVLKGLAAWAGITHHPAADSPAVPRTPRGTLLLLNELQQAAQTLDAGNWRAALMEIESGWLKTLSAALRSGRLSSLRLTALGDDAGLDITLTRSDALKFWRRPRPIHELAFPR